MRNVKGITVLLLLLTAGLAAGCAENEILPGTGDPGLASSESDVIVHLFEWRWDDIVEECETYLGPAGFSAVQVSSPVENSIVDGRPWWERYQVVSYTVDTRSGDREAFADMVSRCRAAGVDIYVDAIFNHMTGVYGGIGTAGSTFAEYEYPGLYTNDDFHHCGLTPGDDIVDWEDRGQVHDCELVNLADLGTEKASVRKRLADYAKDMLDLGVAGFRLDASRHVPAGDIRAILEQAGGEPFVYQEVLDMVPEPTWALEYLPNGSVTEFRYGVALGLIFRSGSLANLHGEGSMWDRASFLPSESVVVFLDNHDTQRHTEENGVLTYRDGSLYELGLVYMLAYPYGRVRVMSSFEFGAQSQGPPALEDESIKRVHGAEGLNCGRGEWVCEHRWNPVAAIVRFRKVTSPDCRVSDWSL